MHESLLINTFMYDLLQKSERDSEFEKWVGKQNPTTLSDPCKKGSLLYLSNRKMAHI